MGGVELRPCPDDRLAEALDLLFRDRPVPERALAVAALTDEIGRGALDPAGLWVALRRGRIVGVVLTQALAGRSAALWPPEVALDWQRPAIAAALVGRALDDYRARGFAVAQAVVPPGTRRGAEALRRGGLRQVTELICLERPTAPPLPVAREIPQFAWRDFDQAGADEFAAVLGATFVGTLDMPELEGVRSLDDVLAGHRAAGGFDPSRWRVGRLPGEPDAAAIVLLSAWPEGHTWELTYLGLTPTARGRGLGRAALAFALGLARPQARRLELALDARNEPAARLYDRAGFATIERRAVFFAALGGAGPLSAPAAEAYTPPGGPGPAVEAPP